jgi:hypothetical protein
MKRYMSIVSLGVAIAIVVAVVVYQSSHREFARPASSVASSAQAENAKHEPTVNVGSSPGGAPKKSSATVNFKLSFAESHDYWEYANRIYPAAVVGDADAQFYLSRVLEYCDEENRMYFQRRGQKLTLDQALQYAAQRHLSNDIALSVYEKCHEFQEGDPAKLGNSAEWLAKATEAGQPLAEANTATKILSERLQQNFVNAGGVAPPSTAIKNETDPRALFRAAIESRDPEVLFSIGEAQSLLHPASRDINTARFAWWLVACQRGLDCSGSAEWVRNSCANDPSCASASNQSDLVRYLAGDNWPNVQQRAQEISAKLDAGQWDQMPSLDENDSPGGTS